MKLTYNGKVQKGEIKLPRKRLKKEVIQAFEGREIKVTFQRKKKIRSNEQNSYYWGVVIPFVIRGFIDLGNDIQEGNEEHHNAVHELLKGKFLANGEELWDAEGNMLQLNSSTTKCTTSQFMDYLAQIQMWSVEYLNVNIPDPEEQARFDF